MIAVFHVPQGIAKSFVNFSSKNCYILATFFVFGRIVEEHIVFEWFSSVKQNTKTPLYRRFGVLSFLYIYQLITRTGIEPVTPP